MAFITFVEIIDAVIMSALIGYIFYPYFSKFNVFRKHAVHEYTQQFKRRFNWSDFMFSIYLIAPAIILHELGHKFVAIGFGYDATFFGAISLNKYIHGMPFFDFASILMIIAVVTTFLGGTFLFFVPAYVAFSAAATGSQQIFIAFAGPGLNLVLWLGAAWLIKTRRIPDKYVPFAIITSKVDMILFSFNMLPIPGFEGFHVYSGLFKTIF